ncbi:MAG: hypothetical protein ACTHJL_01935 [Amnibacterium sp.]
MIGRPPPDAVLRAFGADGPPVPQLGGRGTSWRAGGLVLKPVEDDSVLRWLHTVAAPRVRPPALRLGLPAVTADGEPAVDGWCATAWLPGAAATGRWAERARVARRLAAAFADVDPASLPHRDDPWARAERAAWGEEDGPFGDHPRARTRPAAPGPAAIVHADLAGNTLLHPTLPPAVIDLSLTARPVLWSVAVLAVDVVAFESAPLAVLRSLSDDPGFPDLLARALLFRRTADVLLGGVVDPAYERVEAALLAG